MLVLFAMTIWVLLIAALGVLVIMRRRLAGHEDDALHVLDSETDIVSRQQSQISILNRFDRWTMALIFAIIIVAVLLVGLYIHSGFQQGTNFMW